MADAAKPERLTLGEALKDFGFFSMLFAVTVSGPSVLSLLQAVFVDHKLVDALQWIVDGYNRIVGVLGAMVEPLVQPAIDWVNARWGLQLELQPHWRPLFILSMMWITAYARSAWNDGVRWKAVALGIPMSLGAALGSVSAGLTPLTGAWWVQGMMAALPVFCVTLAMAMWGAVVQFAEERSVVVMFIGTAMLTAVSSGTAFAIGAGLSLVPSIKSGAGIVALGVCTLLLAALSLISKTAIGRRTAVTSLGGYLVAALVIAADAMIEMLG